MKFTISRLHLLAGLNIVSRAVSIKNPVPILTGIKFALTPEGLTLTGSDSDITMITKIPVEHMGEQVIQIVAPGITVVAAKFITDIVRKLESDKISIELVDNTVVKIQDTHSDFNLNSMKSEDYPAVDGATNGSVISLKSEELRTIIQQTVFASSDKETRPILTGVNFRCEGTVLECVGTDSYRLAKKTLTLPTSQSFNVTVPRKTLMELAKTLEGEESVDLVISERKVVFRFPFTQISTRVISGTYPETARLIPTTFENELTTLSQNIISAADRASVLSIERNSIVKLSLSKEKVELISKSHEVGSVVEKIDTFQYKGSRLDISCSAKFMIEAIRAIGTEEVTLLLNGDMKPIIIKNKSDDSVIQLILPVRTY